MVAHRDYQEFLKENFKRKASGYFDISKEEEKFHEKECSKKTLRQLFKNRNISYLKDIKVILLYARSRDCLEEFLNEFTEFMN